METDERLFLRVVQAGSLKAAAEQIGADPSVASRRLARLEERLGVRLLQRSTRRSTPTDAGARYADGLRRLLEEQEALEAEVAGAADVPRGRLRVTAPVDFGARFVVPVLAALQREAPGLEVDALLGSSFLDLAEQGIDVAVRIGRLPDSSLIARRLGSVRRVLVGSPAYLARAGTPQDAASLADHAFVLYARGNAVAPVDLVAPDGARVAVRFAGPLAVNSMSAVVALVEDGHGLHLGPRWAFEDALTTGRLVSLLPGWHLPAYPLHALYVAGPYVPAKVRAFVDGMAERARQEPTLREEQPV